METVDLIGQPIATTPPKSSLRPPESRPTSHVDRSDASRWFMSFSVPTRPRCPSCGGRLIARATRIVSDIAVCEVCVDRWLDNFAPFVAAVESLAGPSEVYRSRGVTFWTPPHALPEACVYARWLELRGKIKLTSTAMTDLQVQALLDADDGPTTYTDPSPSLSGTDGC